jgi:hypothetical protein
MKSIQQQKSFGEVSTADISWFEGAALGARTPYSQRLTKIYPPSGAQL